MYIPKKTRIDGIYYQTRAAIVSEYSIRPVRFLSILFALIVGLGVLAFWGPIKAQLGEIVNSESNNAETTNEIEQTDSLFISVAEITARSSQPNEYFKGDYEVVSTEDSIKVEKSNIDSNDTEIRVVKEVGTEDRTKDVSVSAKDDALTVDPKDQGLTAGAYKVETVQKGTGIVLNDQKVLWGVLAFNPDYAVYPVGKEAFFSMAVLDDRGKMVCTAAMTIEVTAPNGKVATLSTSDGTVRVNKDCEVYGKTDKPDYEANYQPTVEGDYRVKIIAKAGEGTRTLHDQFSVKANQDFYIQRVGATRTYPPVDYDYTINFIAKKSGKYAVTEKTPNSFEIKDTEAEVIDSEDETKELKWQLSAKAGQTYPLTYTFKTPNISPYIFELGALEVTDDLNGQWTEPRSWLIASDNACQSTGTGNWNTAGTWTSCGGTVPQTTDTVTILNTHVVTLNTSPTVIDVTINNGGTLNAGGCSPGSCTLTVSGNWSNSGTFTHGSGTVTFSSTATGKTLAGTMTGTTGKFYNLTFNGVSGGWTFSNAVEVANDFNGTNGAITAGNQNLTVTRDFILANTSGVSYTAGSSTLDITRHFTDSGDKFVHGTSTITMSGTGTFTAASNSQFNNLQWGPSGFTTTISTNNWNVYGTLTFNGGTVTDAGATWLNIFCSATCTPVVFASPTTLTGNRDIFYRSSAASVTVTIAGGNYGSWGADAYAESNSITYQLGGNVTSTATMKIQAANGITGSTFTTTGSNYSISTPFFSIADCAPTRTGAWAVSFNASTVTLTSTTTSLGVGLNCGSHTLNMGSSTISAAGSVSFVNGTGTIAVTPGTSTFTFNAVATGKTITSNGQSFYNLVFNGSGGGWIIQDAMSVTNNFSITNGTFDTKSGSNYALTVGGNLTGNAGTWSFEMRASTITVSGNWDTSAVAADSSSLLYGTSTVVMDGTGTKTIKTGSTNVWTSRFYNLNVGQEDGKTTQQLQSFGVNNVFTLGAGTFDLNTYSLFMESPPTNPLSLAGTFGTGNGRIEFYSGSASFNLPAYTYNSQVSNGLPNGYSMIFQGTTTITSDLVVSNCCSRANITNLNGQTVTVGHVTWSDAAGILTMGASTLNVGGNWTNTLAGTFNKDTSTVNFTSTSTGRTITSGGRSFYKVTFNGSGGGWAPQDAMTVTNDLTMTAGTLSGTQNVTVNGHVAGTAGIINLTGGTFKQTVPTGGKNFGTTSGSTAWTFYNLTFTSCVAICNPTETVTTQTGGTGGITVTGVLYVGDTGDSSITALNAGNRTWTLSGTGGDPFQLHATNGSLVGATSTFSYTGANGGGNTTVQVATYCNLSVGGSTADTFVLEGNTTTSNVASCGDLTINATGVIGNNVLDVVSGPEYSLTIGGNFTNNATFSAQAGTVTFNATDSGNTLGGTMTGASSFYNLVFNGVAGGWTYSNAVAATNDFTVTNGAVTANNLALTVTRDFTLANTAGVSYTAGSSTITVSRHWNDTGAKYVNNSSTIVMNGTGTFTNLAGTTLPNLSFGYTGFVTTLSNNWFNMASGSVLTFNGGTVTGSGAWISPINSITSTPVVFAAPTTLNGTQGLNFQNSGSGTTMTMAGGDYGTWNLYARQSGTAFSGTVQLGGNLTTTGFLKVSAVDAATALTFDTTASNYSLTIGSYVNLGEPSYTKPVAMNLRGSTVSVGGSFTPGINNGTHTLNLGTSSLTVSSNLTFVNGTGTIAVTPGTSTVTMTATATGKTITSNAQSFYNIVFNGVGGGWTLQDAMSVTNNFDITNGTFDTNTTYNYSLTVGGNLTGNAGTWSLTERASTITVSGNWDTSAVATDDASIVEGTSTVVMNGTGTKTIKTGATSNWRPRFYNLNVGQSGNTTQMIASFGINGTISLGTGTFSLNGYTLSIESLITSPFSLNPSGTWGVGNGALIMFNDSYPTQNYTLPAFTYNSNLQTNQTTGTKTTFLGTTIINGNLTMGCCSRASEFDLNGQTVTVSGNVLFGTTTAILTMGAATLNIGGNFTNVAGAVFTANTSTVNFTSTSTGKTITSAGDSFYNLTFNGSGGGWTPQDALAVTNDLTMTAGTLSGTQNVTVNGAVAGTAGIISLTGGTFKQMVASNKNFGTTSGSTAWTFNNLTFTTCIGICSPTITITTQTGGTGGITVSGILTVGDTGDSSNTALNAGNRTWTLSGTGGDPFQLHATKGSLVGATSTFTYTGANAGGNTTVQVATYCNLSIGGAAATDTYVLEGATVTSNAASCGDLTIVEPGVVGNNVLDVVSGSNWALTIGGNFLNGDTFSAQAGTVTFNATDSGNTLSGNMTGASAFYNLTFNGVAGGWTYSNAVAATNDFTVTNGAVTANNLALTVTRDFTLTNTAGVAYTAGSSTVTVSRHWTDNGYKFVYGTSTVVLNGTGTFTTAVTYYLNSLSMGYSGLTTTFNNPSATTTIYGTLTFNGGTVTANAALYKYCTSTCATPVVFASPTTLNGSSGQLIYTVPSANVTVTIPGADYGTWTIQSLVEAGATGAEVFNFGGNVTTTGNYMHRAKAATTITLNTQNYSLTAARLDLGSSNSTVSTTTNFGSSVITLTSTVDSLQVTTDSGSHSLNLQTSTVNIYGSTKFLNGTGTVTVNPGTSTVNMLAVATGKTITSNAQSFYNLVFNGVGGGWTFQDATITTNDFTVTNGAVTANNLALTVTRDFTLANTAGVSYTAGSSTVTVSRHWNDTGTKFVYGTSTVALNGTGTIAVAAAASFNNLSVGYSTFTTTFPSASGGWSMTGQLTFNGGTVTNAGGGTWFYIRVNGTNNTPFVFASPTTITGINAPGLWTSANGPYTVTVAGGNYGSWSQNLWAAHTGVTFQLGGNVTTTGNFSQRNTVGGDTIFNTQNYDLTADNYQFGHSGGTGCLATTANWGSSTITLANTSNALYVNSNCGTHNLNMQTSNLSLKGHILFANGTGAITNNAGTSTTTFTNTSTTANTTLNGQTLYNSTLNGSGGTVTPLDAMVVTNDLTMTAGTLSGTQNITVNGNVAGTAGIISLTGGTFEQRVATSKNFGTTSGTTAWTFSSLTFSNPNTEASINTVTTQTGGSGGITVSGVLRIGKAGDVDQTVLNAGNRIWTLSGTAGDPFQILASPLGALTGGTSKFYYTGANAGGNTTIQSTSGSYYDLELNAADTFVLEADTVVTNNLTITHASAILDVTAAPYALTIGGNYSNSGTFTARTGTVTLNGSATQTLSGGMLTTNAFYNLTLTNSSGTSPSDNERTGWVAGIDFNAAATVTNNYVITTANVRVEYNSGSTYTIANINWNGAAIGTRIYFRNSAITGTWLLNVSGTQTAVSYVNVSRSDASSGSAIVASDGTNFNAQNNTNWTFSGTVTGTVYGTDETTAVVSGPTVRMYINGTTTETTTANGSGVFTFTTGANANDVISIYLDTAGGITGMTVTKATGSDLSNIHIYQDRLTTRCDNTCSLTNANIDNWDKGNDTDIHATVTTSNLVVDNDWKLKVTNNTFAPGGTITTTPAGGASYQGQVGIDASATLDMAGNALSIGGNYSNSGTFTSGSNTTTFTDTATGNTLAGTMTGASSFYNLVFDGVAGGWTYSAAVAASNDFTVTNGAVTANNLALTVTRDFTLANTAGVSYTAGSSTVTASRHFTDAGAKYSYGTSTVILDGTGTLTLASSQFLYNLSVAYSGFTTTNSSAGSIYVINTTTFNGGALALGSFGINARASTSTAPVVFASPTTITGTGTINYLANASSITITMAGADHGSANVLIYVGGNNSVTYNFGGNITTTGYFNIKTGTSSTGAIINTQNYSLSSSSLGGFGDSGSKGPFTMNFGSSTVSISGGISVTTDVGGSKQLNYQTATISVGTNISYVSGTGNVTVDPGTSTVTMTATATGKTITSNGQSFYNLVFNGVGGGWTLQDAMSVTNNFDITNGTFDTNTTYNYSLTVGGNLTGNAGTWSLTERASTITVSGNWDTSAVAQDSVSIVEGTSTVVMNGTGTKTIKNGPTNAWEPRFYNLTVGQNGNTTQLITNNGAAHNGTFTLGTGTFDFNSKGMNKTGGGFSFDPAGTFGLGNGSLDFSGSANFTLPAFTYNTTITDNISTGYKVSLVGTTTITGSLRFGWGSSRNSEFDTANQTLTVGTYIVAGNTGAPIFTAGSSTVYVGTNFTNESNAVFNAGTSTFIFNATATGKTIQSAGDSFYNLTFNGSGGGWTPQDALAVTNDLTMTAGTLSGTQNVTVNGNVAGTAGIISLTGGTFEQRVGAAKNFGTTSGSTAWTFYDLTFSNSHASSPFTVTTQTGGTGGITVSDILKVGKSGDAAGATTTLNAGNRTWTLSGTGGDPFQILASPLGVLTGSTSTFKYTGNNAAGNTTVQSTTYNNLEINDGLVGYWKLDEGTGSNAANVSGNGGNATLGASTATPTWSTDTKSNDYYGGAGSNPYSLSFDGGDDVDTGIDYSWAVADSFSMSFWIKPTSVTGNQGVMGKPASSGWEWSVYMSGSNLNFLYWNTGGGNEIFLGSTVTINTWDYFTITYDPTNKARMYKNGTLVYTDATVNPTLQNRSNTVHLGQTYFSGSQQYFTGLLDDIRFYDRSMGTGEITSLAAGNHPTYETYVLEADTTVTGNLGVRTGALDVTASNYALTVGGNLTNVSNFAPNSGTVTMNSTASGKTIQSDPAFYKLKFHNASGGGGWTSQNRLLVDTTSGTPAADALVIGNGTVTIGDGDDDNLLVYGGIDIAVNANETGILQTVDSLAEGSTITLQVNKDTSTQCANCIVDVGASSGSGQGTLTINENGILKLIPKSSATASDTGVAVASTGKLNVTGALSLAETTSTAITDYDNRETKICANADFSAGYTSKHVRTTSGLAIGQIYAITATTVDDVQCDTGTHDSITRADTSTASVVSASKTLSNNNGIMSVCIPDTITAHNQKIGSYMRDFTGTKGYFQIVDSVNDDASCTGTNDLLKVIESPDVFSGFTAGDTVDISDGVRPGDNFEIYDYAHVTAEDGVACTATVNEAGESYLRGIAGSETVVSYADICNLGRNATGKEGVRFDNVNGTNANEGVTIDRTRSRSNYYGTVIEGCTNNNTGNSKGISNSSATGNTIQGFRIANNSDNNTLTSNRAASSASGGFGLSAADNNTFSSNIAIGTGNTGFLLQSSNNNTFSSNIAIGNSNPGFYIAPGLNNTFTSNTAIGNASSGFIVDGSTSKNNTFTSNTATGNANGFVLNTGASNNIFTGNISGGQTYGFQINSTAAATGNVVINDVYGTISNTTADIGFAGTGAHTLSLYNTTLSSTTEVTGVTVAASYIVSRKHDTSAGATKIWGEYAIPADTAETPQDEDTDKFNYANNLWEKSVTAHGYSGTGTEDTDLSYDLSAPADLSAGPYTYRLVTKTAGVGASCVTSQAVMDVYRNGTDVGDLTTGTQFTDSTGGVNTKFTVDCGTTPYALNATYTFTAYDADNSTTSQKTTSMMQDGDIFTVGSGKTLELKGNSADGAETSIVTRGASGGYHFDVAGTIDAQYYKFSYLGGTGGGSGLDLQSGATLTNLDDGTFDNFQNVGATDTYITVHGSLIGSGAPAKTWDNMTFLEASDNVPEFSVTQTATGAPAAGNYWSFFGSTCTGWTDCEASDSDTGDGGTDTYGFLHFSSSVSVQGVVYLANESTIGTSGNGGPCDGSTAVITARVNGGSAATATCSASTAAYTVYLAITPTAGQTITIYLTSASKGNTVTLSDGATDTGVDIYIDHVVVRHENAGPQTNAGLDLYDIDQNATDMLFTVDLSEILTITAGKELHITTGKTFTPGGAVTTGLAGDVHIAGTLSMGGSALSIGGSYNNTGTFTSASNTTTFTSTATGKTLAGTMTGASSFYNLVFDGVAGGWTYSAAVAATNDFTVTNGAVTAGNQNLTVTRDFTLANTAGVSYTAGSSTLDIARHFNDTGNKFVYGTSTVSMTGTGTATIGNGLNFFNLNLGYTGFTTTLSNNNLIVRGQLFFNGGTVSSAGSYLSIYCAVTCTPIVFNSATTLSGTRNMYLDATASAVTTTIAAGDYGSWKLTPFVTSGSSTSAVYNLAGNITTTQEFWLEAAVGSTGNVFNTQNFSLTALRLSIGDESRTASWTMNLGSSSLTFSSVANGFMVASNGGSHTLNMSTSLMTVYGNLLLANGTGNITTSPGTSTVTFAAVATGKTITSNAQSFYNLVFNGVGGGWTFQDATIATNDFTVTNGAVTANNLALTVTRDFTLANTSGVAYTAGSSTVTVSRHWNDTGTKFVYGTSTVAMNGTGTITVVAATSFYNLSVGYSTFTTTFPATSSWSMSGQLTFNGGSAVAGAGTYFNINVNSTNNNPVVFASATTITGSNDIMFSTNAVGPYTVTIAGGNYGSWGLNLRSNQASITFQLGGNVTTTSSFWQRNYTGGDTIFNTQNYNLTANIYRFGQAGAGCLTTTSNWGSSTITLTSTGNALYVDSNCGAHNLNMQTSNLSMKGHILFVNGTGTVTNNAGTSTTTFTNTATTANVTLNGQSLYNLILNGSGGTVTPLGAVAVTNDLTMTAGTLSGTQNVTVNGAVAGTAGIISLTGGTFEQRVGAAKNFGTTSGSTAWTFYDLTFSNSHASSPFTVTTQTGGSGGITVSSVLSIGVAGDSDATVLDAGNRTWTLSGTGGDPFQILASPLGVLTPATSTFKYSGNNGAGNTTVQSTTYNNLEINDGLQGYWKLDETTTTAGATVMDVSGNANTGTPNGAGGANNLPQPSTDVPSVNYYGGSGSDPRSLDFDGTDDYVAVTNSASLQPVNITVSAWIKTSLVTTRQDIANKYNSTGNGIYGIQVSAGTADKVRMTVRGDNGVGLTTAESTTSVTTGQWVHVVGIRNTATDKIEIYVNGVLESSVTDNTTNNPTTGNLAIGRSGDQAAFYFNGLIDDVRVYNRALTQAEITSLAAGNHPTYETYVLEGATTVTGNLGVRTGNLDTVSGSNHGLTVGGNLTNVSNFAPNTGTVTMNSTASGKTIQSDPAFYNITYDGVSGAWTYQNRQLATNDFTVTNGAVTANNLALTVTRDFTLANTAGVSYTAGSSTVTVSRHWNDAGIKFVSGTSTVVLNGTGTVTFGVVTFYNLSIGYTGFTTTLPNTQFIIANGGTLTFNGGTVAGGGSNVVIYCNSACTPVVFASPTTLTGSRIVYYQSNGAGFNVTIAGGNYGSWQVSTNSNANNTAYILGGNLITTSSFTLRSPNGQTGNTFTTQNYSITAVDFTLGYATTGAWTANFGSSAITLTGNLGVASNGGAHTLNLQTSSVDIKGNVNFLNGTGTVTVDPGTSTVTWTHTSGTKTYAPNGQSLYNVVLNASGGTVQPSGAVSVEGDFTITAGTYDTVSGQNHLLTLYKNFTNNGTFLAQQGEVYWNGITPSAFNGTFTGSSSLYNLSIYPLLGAGGPPADCERTSFVPDVDFNSAVTATGLVSVGGGGSAGIEFQNGTTYNFNDINFNGQDASNRVFLRNSAASGSWNLNVTAVGSAQTKIRYVNVSRSDASSGAQIIASDGTNVDCNNNVNWMFDEELIITLDATSKNFGTLTPGSNPTDQTSTVTVTTNANNGYIVYAWTDQPMTFSSWTIPDWAGTNTTPTTWPNGSYGFGYSTDDSSLTGGTADRFTNGGPKFAGFGHTGPGDPVADRTAPATAAQNIITYRLAPDSTQTAGVYQATVVYVASVRFP